MSQSVDTSAIASKALEGERYEDTIPDTLDLAERAALAINGIGGSIDPELWTMYGQIHFCTPTPHQSHWACAENTCDPKFAESLPMMRVMSGSGQYAELEAEYFAAMLSRVQDGLYWDLADPRRPWRNAYAPAFYGEGKDEDFAVVGASGRMARALSVWHQVGGSDALDGVIRSLVAGMRRVAICRDDYCYYPEKGGWGEPCTYPRSGWLNTDEPESETQGGEGAITAYHGHQIYAASQWYTRSGDPVALDLAARLMRFCMKPKFWGGVPDAEGDRTGLVGHVAACQLDPPFTAGAELGHWYSHFHARAIALRGLLEYGRAAEDLRVLEFVRRAYEFTLTQGIPRIGWINCYPAAVNHCEGCALGDLVALGVRLSDYGLGDFWDDVDAVARNHLVEQQLTGADLVERVSCNCSTPDGCEANPLPGQLSYEDVIRRSLGTFGGTSLPTGLPHPSVMHCCTGNGTQGLYYAWEGTVREEGDRAQVNLLLNRAAKLLDIHSYLPYEGKVVLRNKTARRIRVRIPHWVSRREVRAETSGAPRALDWVGNYVLFDDLRPGDILTLTFPITEAVARYTVNAHSAAEQVYTCTFRGSTLVDISPRGESPTSYPFYLRDQMRKGPAPMKTVGRFVAKGTVLLW